MTTQFQKATKYQLKARIALLGPAGSGKSYTALRLAFALAGAEGKVAAIDTEHRSLSKYVGEAPDGVPWQFDVLELEDFSAESYTDGIALAQAGGYAVLIIDSLSHAWAGKGGILEFVDETTAKAAAQGKKASSFDSWRKATPKHNSLVEAMLAAKLHLIVAMRVKQDYVQEKDDTGRTVIRKVGLQPVQRDGLEYEFDVTADLDMENNLVVSKTRCPALSGKLFPKPGPEVVEVIRAWLESGTPVQERAAVRQIAAKSGAKSAGEVKAKATPWTQNVSERKSFKAFLGDRLTEAEARAIAAEAMGQEQPIARFSEWPHTRERLQHVLLGWLLRNRPWADPATHWMDTDPKAKASFWAEMGSHGYDEVKVHEIIPSLHAWPGSAKEAVDYILSALPEDRGQLPLPETAEEASW